MSAENIETTDQPGERWEAVGQCIRTLTNPDRTGGYLVAEVPVHRPDLDQITAKIAAVPEMIEALQRVKEMLRDGVSQGWIRMPAAGFAVQDAVHDALSKATGGA